LNLEYLTRKGLHPGADGFLFFESDHTKVVAALEIDPKLRIHAEKRAEDKSGFGGDRAFCFDNLVYRSSRSSLSIRPGVVSMMDFCSRVIGGSG
jgi:hypothetical protein|tara:strand:- start:5151 stop:5432 length:282 start_codon:yes stop_codon:yes gene_type:complete